VADILIDIHEPSNAPSLIGQSVEAEVESLNSQGYADYLWQGVEGKKQWERKTWFEILGDMDSVEDQLRREVQAHLEVETSLVVEGVATPTFNGCQVWVPNKGKKQVMYPGRSLRANISKAYAWFYQVTKFMPVYFTPSFECTCIFLVAAFKADQREDHGTFNRYLKSIDFHPNPQVEGLMNISRSAGIGAARAKALIKRFGTIWNVLNQMPSTLASVDNMGETTAKKLLRKVGRTDI